MPTHSHLRLFLRWALGQCPVAQDAPAEPPPRRTLLNWRAVAEPLPEAGEDVDDPGSVDDDGSEADVIRLADWRAR